MRHRRDWPRGQGATRQHQAPVPEAHARGQARRPAAVLPLLRRPL